MTELTANQIKSNWEKFLNLIEENISSPRKEKLLDFYKKHEDYLILMPASNKKQYHNAIPGGYIDHIIRVTEAALKLEGVWASFGARVFGTYTTEELVFSALNHDLGKMGDEDNYMLIEQKDNWKLKHGELYSFNTKIQFMKVPDRTLFILNSNNIQVSQNEWIAIQTHDGLFDEGNKSYLISYYNETKPRTALPYILHQADMLAARVEWERDNLEELLNGNSNLDKKTPLPKKDSILDEVSKNVEEKKNIKNKKIDKSLTDLMNSL